MNQLPDTPRRFIAGAKCPACQGLDKVVMFRKDGIQYRECVSCGYSDDMPFEQNFRELETRVNRPSGQQGDDVSVVRLLTPDPDGLD